MLFINATAFLARFESLSMAGTFQTVGRPRHVRLCALNWKQSVIGGRPEGSRGIQNIAEQAIRREV